MYAAGELSAKLTEIYFGERPAEELYDVIEDPSQLNNLALDPEYAAVLKQHRELLEQWIAQGDAGIEEESDEELAYQGREHKWGTGVNPEYERVRADTDGDGLSDIWEKVNGRDPLDGKLLFTFDCGGWQTEGWNGSSELNNIAGAQGYLDFNLGKTESTLSRSELRLDANKNLGDLVIKARADHDVILQLVAGSDKEATIRKTVGQVTLKAGNQWSSVAIPLSKNKAWQGVITQLDLKLNGPEGTKVEFDSIEVR